MSNRTADGSWSRRIGGRDPAVELRWELRECVAWPPGMARRRPFEDAVTRDGGVVRRLDRPATDMGGGVSSAGVLAEEG